MRSKIFVLDTNVILHDHKAIRNFQDNNLVIPVAVVEELDKFKKGTDALAFNARGFMRDLDRITEGRLFGKQGIPIGKGLGNIKVEPNHPFPEEFKDLFKDDIQDHRILATAMWVRDNNPGTFVALVTKDVNLRMKAKAAGMEVQDYLTDRVEEKNIEAAQKEVPTLDVAPEVLQTLMHSQERAVEWKSVTQQKPSANKLFKLFWKGSKSKEPVCARYDAVRDRIVLVRGDQACGVRPRNDEQKMALDACLNPAVRLVSLTGGSGTGKTILALAAALEQAREYDQIIITRPAVVYGGQNLDFLPADQRSKISPYLDKILIKPLDYIRGRSLDGCFLIVDDAQNLTPQEVKSIITKAGEGTKMVFTGNVFQIDQPYLDQWSNGLTHLGQKMEGQRLFEHVFLRKGERSELSDIASRLL